MLMLRRWKKNLGLKNIEESFMPAAPRPKGKAKKVAYDILGKPANLRGKKKKDKVKQRLDYEETRFSR